MYLEHVSHRGTNAHQDWTIETSRWGTDLTLKDTVKVLSDCKAHFNILEDHTPEKYTLNNCHKLEASHHNFES